MGPGGTGKGRDSSPQAGEVREGRAGPGVPRPGETPAWEEVGLTAEEYERIRGLLGRDPNQTELGMFGLMWSEHCSYKTSGPPRPASQHG